MNENPFFSLRRPSSAASPWTRRGINRLAIGAMVWLGLHAAPGQDEAAARKKKRRQKKAKTRLDLTCPGPAINSVGLEGDDRLGQVFTASRKGELVKAEILIGQDPNTSGNYLLHLATVDAAGVPTNNYRATAVIPSGNVPDGESVLTFSFPSPAKVAAGKSYALILTRPAASDYIGLYGSGPCGGPLFQSQSFNGNFQLVSSPTEFALIFSTFIRA